MIRTPGVDYSDMRAAFAWSIPARFNIATACVDQQSPVSVALIQVNRDGEVQKYTFGQLRELSNRFANALTALGVRRGDRVGVVLPQCVETAITHLASYKLGAIVVPLSRLFGPDALRHRLTDAGVRAVVAGPDVLDRVVESAADCDEMQIIVPARSVSTPHHSFWDALWKGAASSEDVQTAADDPALLIYTSGTTGAPKGALHAHRVLLGHLPGFDLMYDFFGEVADRMWTPADWAWIGGLLDSLLPTWWHGRPVVCADRQGFDPQWAIRLMVQQHVRNAFLPPTVLRLLRDEGGPHEGLDLRSVMSGGESLGEDMLEWGKHHLGVTINEIYGQTEVNLVVGNSQRVWAVRPGSMGRPFPGHRVTVLDDSGYEAPVGRLGEIAVSSPDPAMFLNYWRQPHATNQKFRNEWLLTGDLGVVDDDGYLWFKGRSDDLIISAGYRIGPEEIEQCLAKHPAVAMAGVVGVPDETRGEVAKAYVKLRQSYEASAELAREIQHFVRGRLAAHEYPRHISFVDDLPTSTTGKIRRAELRGRDD